ncbi:MAG: hypothetical protein ABIF19_08510 [Planctomycetota bacterium]
MKRLLLTIMLAALVMSLAGCVVVEEHHHHARRPYGVIVANPRPVVIAPGRPPYPHPPHNRGGYGRHGF